LPKLLNNILEAAVVSAEGVLGEVEEVPEEAADRRSIKF
jgi:hypothetical protein